VPPQALLPGPPARGEGDDEMAGAAGPGAEEAEGAGGAGGGAGGEAGGEAVAGVPKAWLLREVALASMRGHPALQEHQGLVRMAAEYLETLDERGL